MALTDGLLSGILQGLTEFLPVSSSGHLELYRKIFGETGGQDNVFFDLFLHIGSLLAIIVYYRRDIVRIVAKDRKMLVWIALGTVVFLAVGGGIAKGFDYEERYAGNLFLLAGCFIFTGTLLFASERLAARYKDKKELGTVSTLVIGAAEGLAVLRGVSRSGSTIATGLMLGLEKKQAAMFSFLLSIPAIVAGFGYKLLKTDFSAGINVDMGIVLPATIASFVISLLSVHLLVKLIARQKFSWFAFYLWTIGLVSLYLALNSV